MNLRPAAALAIRIVLGVIFIVAGALKGYDSGSFALALIPFTFVPPSWIPHLSVILPIAELAAGLLILLGPTKRAGAALIVFLCLSFLIALGWALSNGIIVACSCFGREQTPSSSAMLTAMARDAAVAVAALLILCDTGGSRRKSR